MIQFDLMRGCFRTTELEFQLTAWKKVCVQFRPSPPSLQQKLQITQGYIFVD